jgi:hypothetical protein
MGESKRTWSLSWLRMLRGREGRRRTTARVCQRESEAGTGVSLEQSRGDCGPHIYRTRCSNSCPPNGRGQFLPPPGTDVHRVKKSPVVSISLLRKKRVLSSSWFIITDVLLWRGTPFPIHRPQRQSHNQGSSSCWPRLGPRRCADV